METHKVNLNFINMSVNPEMIKRIKNDPQLKDIQNYINNNPRLIENQVKLYEIDNNTMAFNKIDINKIITKIRDIYNNELLEKDKIPSPSLEDNDFPNEENGIQLTFRKGGKTKRRKRSQSNKRFIPRYKKKTLRKKRKQKNFKKK
jgi:hypothetical protein